MKQEIKHSKFLEMAGTAVETLILKPLEYTLTLLMFPDATNRLKEDVQDIFNNFKHMLKTNKNILLQNPEHKMMHLVDMNGPTVDFENRYLAITKSFKKVPDESFGTVYNNLVLSARGTKYDPIQECSIVLKDLNAKTTPLAFKKTIQASYPEIVALFLNNSEYKKNLDLDKNAMSYLISALVAKNPKTIEVLLDEPSYQPLLKDEKIAYTILKTCIVENLEEITKSLLNKNINIAGLLNLKEGPFIKNLSFSVPDSIENKKIPDDNPIVAILNSSIRKEKLQEILPEKIEKPAKKNKI